MASVIGLNEIEFSLIMSLEEEVLTLMAAAGESRLTLAGGATAGGDFSRRRALQEQEV